MFSFLSGTLLISLQWSLIGIGLRLALDVGAHLNSSFAAASIAEREQWKRAFWYVDCFGSNLDSAHYRMLLGDCSLRTNSSVRPSDEVASSELESKSHHYI